MSIKTLVAIVIAAGSLVGCATVVRERVVVKEPPQHVVVKQMPAPLQEARPAPPGPGYGWVGGYWVWQNHGWYWQAGHWRQGMVRPMPAIIVEQITVAPSSAHYWVPGHWHWVNGDWRWTGGHWAS